MNEIICIDDEFTQEQILHIPNRPVKDKIYTIRDIFYLPSGEVGIHLHELTNPNLPHPSGLGTFEPNFNSKRFTTLNNQPINYEKVTNFIKLTTSDRCIVY
jgi:hypothetical protein